MGTLKPSDEARADWLHIYDHIRCVETLTDVELEVGFEALNLTLAILVRERSRRRNVRRDATRAMEAALTRRPMRG